MAALTIDDCQKHRRHRRGPDGQRHRAGRVAGGLRGAARGHRRQGARCIGREHRQELERQIARGKLTEDEKNAALKRIRASTDFKPVGQCDVVVEAATEREALKREIYAKLVPELGPDAIVASNTSSISITRLAAATDRPARFIGMHFMNPVPAMQLVELIRGIATDEATFQAIHALAVKLGKTPVAAEDFPAFIVNRILLPMINEAVYTLYEGVGTVVAIDTAMKLGAHHPMGPLELADFIGLDTCLAVMQVLHEGLADSNTALPAAGEICRSRAGSAARPAAAFTIIAAKSRCRRASGLAYIPFRQTWKNTIPLSASSRTATIISLFPVPVISTS